MEGHVRNAVCLRLAILFADDDVLEHFVVPHHQAHFLLEGVTCCAICTKETRVWLRFAKELLCDGSVDDIVAETFEIARMMGASMRKRGYSGWASS